MIVVYSLGFFSGMNYQGSKDPAAALEDHLKQGARNIGRRAKEVVHEIDKATQSVQDEIKKSPASSDVP